MAKTSQAFQAIKAFITLPRLLLLIILLFAAYVRLWQLTQVPSGLYWDERDVGYQAYSFLLTGRDYFGNFLPIHFHSFADYRTPLYIYATVPFVKILGLTALAVRLPAALFGLLDIVMIYLVTKELLNDEKWAWGGALTLALAPWHLQFSRMGFEVTLMLFVYLVGLYGFLRALRQPKWLYLAAVGFGLSPWAYSTAKLFVPLFLLILAGLYGRALWRTSRSTTIKACILVVLIGLPLLYSNFFMGGGQRFSEITIVSDRSLPNQVNESRTESSLAYSNMQTGNSTSLSDAIAYNKIAALTTKLTANYMRSFSTEFLFGEGDPNLRHSPLTIGELYKIYFIFLIFGFIFFVKYYDKNPKVPQLLGLWLILAPIPAAITQDGGVHATRLFFMLPAFSIVIAGGIAWLFAHAASKLRIVGIALCFVILALEAFAMHRYYFGIYQFESAPVFDYGHDQIMDYVAKHQSDYENIYIDGYKNWALMSYLFDLQKNPAAVQALAPFEKIKETVGEIEGHRFGNVVIATPKERSWYAILMGTQGNGKNLYILSAQEIGDDINRLRRETNTIKIVTQINYPDNTPAYYVLEH